MNRTRREHLLFVFVYAIAPAVVANDTTRFFESHPNQIDTEERDDRILFANKQIGLEFVKAERGFQLNRLYGIADDQDYLAEDAVNGDLCGMIITLDPEHVRKDERWKTKMSLMGIIDEMAGDDFPLETVLLKIGGAVWVILQGEHYSTLQTTLRERFPETPLIIATTASHWGASYLPPRKLYDKGLYQKSIAITAPGSLETVIEKIGYKIEFLLQ